MLSNRMAVKLFERQWLANLILWGNYALLRDAALSELGESLSGNTLQVACVYESDEPLESKCRERGRFGGRRRRAGCAAAEPAGQVAEKCPGPAPCHGRHRSRVARRQLRKLPGILPTA